MGKVFRKLSVTVLIVASVLISADCKKQVRCGCGEDVVRTLENSAGGPVPVYIAFNADKSSIWCSLVGDATGSPYTFCNAAEMVSSLADAKYGDIMLVRGEAYWDCSYVYSASNSPYQYSYAQYYQLHVTELTLNLYGKKAEKQQN
jgi:hypothetical protein